MSAALVHLGLFSSAAQAADDRTLLEGYPTLLSIARKLDEIDVIVGWLCTVLLVDSALERLHESQPGPASRRGAGSRELAPLRQAMDDVIDRLACCALRDEDFEPRQGAPGVAPGIPALAPLLIERIRNGVQEQWRELRVIEREVEAVSLDLQCDDPLYPEVRAYLEACKRRLRALAEETPYVGEPIALGEPDEELLTQGQRVFGHTDGRW